MNRVGPHQLQALDFFVNYGITAYRMTKDGQIAWVKDTNLGWLAADRWLLMKRIKDALASPLVGELVEGGYRLNANIYALSLEVAIAGFEIPLPVGPGLVLLTGTAILVAFKTGDYQTALTLLAALMAPYGSLYLLYYWADVMFDKSGQLLDVVKLTQGIQAPLIVGAAQPGAIEASPIVRNLRELWESIFGGGGTLTKTPPAA